ncbi:MAG: GntR family transcriptional regulator [Gammaproteobacteria bacterium]
MPLDQDIVIGGVLLASESDEGAHTKIRLSPEDMREIYEILTALESEAAARLAQRKLSKKDLQMLDKATSDMERALKKGNLDAWAEADARFHKKLLELHGNKRLSTFIQSLNAQAHRVRMITLRLRKAPAQSTLEHRKILDCIEAGSAEDARKTFGCTGRERRKNSLRFSKITACSAPTHR